MLIHRFNPSDHFRTLDLLFDAMGPSANARRKTSPPGRAKLHVEELEQAFVLRAELPGQDPEALTLEVGEDWIVLAAKRAVEAPEGYRAIRRERGSYQLERRLQLPKRVDADAVEATLRDGLLTVRLPKLATTAPRSVAIKAA